MNETFYQNFIIVFPLVASVAMVIGIAYLVNQIFFRPGDDFEWVDESGKLITVRHKNMRLQLSLKPYKAFKKRFSHADYARFAQQLEEINRKERSYLNRYGSFTDYVQWVNGQFAELQMPLDIENDTTSSFEYDGVKNKVKLREILPENTAQDWQKAFMDDTLNEDKCTATHFLIRPYEHFEATLSPKQYSLLGKFTRLSNAIIDRNIEILGQTDNPEATVFYDIVFIYLHTKSLDFERDFECDLDAMRNAFADFKMRKAAEEFEQYQQDQ